MVWKADAGFCCVVTAGRGARVASGAVPKIDRTLKDRSWNTDLAELAASHRDEWPLALGRRFRE